MLVDEGGGGVEERYGKTFLLPGTGEKGNVSPMVTVETAGGHSYGPFVSYPSYWIHTDTGRLPG
jgi:hypothetical protein